ncbi:MAG: cupin domain-containing protein [candidate division Zixibacteria bacterium]|nr:cupin domain-containing protein [candidate division Zixibacteria bacterium]
MSFEYPDFIRKLPEADIPFNGVKGHLMSSDNGLAIFFEIDPIGQVPEHSHGAQWGIVLSGSMKLTIDGETKVFKEGDKYYIPRGVKHSAEFQTKFFAIDFFEEPDRYTAKA